MSAEHDTVELLSGEDPLGIDEAFHLLRLLVPILDTAPHDEEAQFAASSVIQRMPYDSAATAMLDWWFVVTTGTRTPPLGLAYTLPDSIDEPSEHDGRDACTRQLQPQCAGCPMDPRKSSAPRTTPYD